MLSVRAESRLSEPQEVGQLAEKGCHELLLQNRGHAGCGRSGGGHGSEVGPVVAEVLLNQGKNNLGGHISVPNRQNTARLIFGKNELRAFSESLRPPVSIARSIMILSVL